MAELLELALTRNGWVENITANDITTISQALYQVGYTEASVFSLGFLKPELDLTIHENDAEVNLWNNFTAPQRAGLRIIF